MIRSRFTLKLAMAVVVFGTTACFIFAATSDEEFSPSEFAVLSRVVYKKGPLDSNDLNALRQMMKGYVARTGRPLTRQDVNSLMEAATQANAYYYELAKSMLISWDGEQYQTTKAFDTLYLQMKASGGRKPAKLSHDLERIKLAARRAPVESDDGGIQHTLDRRGIVNTLSQVKVAMDNAEKVISVLNETAR